MPVPCLHGRRRGLSRCRALLLSAVRHVFGGLLNRVNRRMTPRPSACRRRKSGLTCTASPAARPPCGCSSVAGDGPSRLETGVRFPPIRSSPGQPIQRTSRMRRAPQAPHVIEAAASRTRASSPCRATRAETGTSPECPQPHVIRNLPPRKWPRRRPSHRISAPSREAATDVPVPAGECLGGALLSGFRAACGIGAEDRNRLDSSFLDEPAGIERLGRDAIRTPLPSVS